ncbi:MAG: hypothetical protein JST00_34450 [Deltaproteobacteria bacterium]|nr:hypothetical protein [Deltaproteobacteria bacterium]
MRAARTALALALGSTLASASACKRTPPATNDDAAAATSAPSIATEPKMDAGREAGSRIVIGTFADAGTAPHPSAIADAGPNPALPLASDKMEVVAIGKSTASRVLWLQEIGGRTWLSARNLDAFADGDGPLVKGPDLVAKLPYKPGVHSMRVVGAYPRLYALRTRNVEGRMDSPEPTAFVYAAEENGPGTWKEAKPLGMSWFPTAFLPFRDGALVVNSQIALNGTPYINPQYPGTTLRFIGPDGSVSDPKLGVHPHFMAWGADSDGSALSLIGCVAIPPKVKGDAGEVDWDFSGTNLFRITETGAKRIPIHQTLGIAMLMYSAKVSERGGRALVIPPGGMEPENEGGWRPNPRTVFLSDDDKAKPRTFAGNESCYVTGARLVGDDIYAKRTCFDEGLAEELVRLRPDGKTEKLALPSIVKDEKSGFRVARSDADKRKAIPCALDEIVVRGKDDVWATANCSGGESWSGNSGVPIVVRRGRPQEPLVLP